MGIIIKKAMLFLMFTFSALGFQQLVLADSNDFSVTPVLTENQNPEVPSYFDLTVTPNQKQTLKIKIKNNSNEGVKYKLYVNTATTNQNGIIDYSINNFEKDESLKLSLKDCLTLTEQLVDVLANSEKEVSLELSVPETPFEGIALGGITVEPSIEKGSNGVNNIFTRTLAIQLTETAKKISPYSIEKMSNGRISTTTASKYRNRVKQEIDPFLIFTKMSYRTIKNFEELAKELKEVNPKTKEEVTMMIDNYSLRNYYKL